MKYLDEEIAKILQKKRKKEREDKITQLEMEEENILLEEQIIDQLQNGEIIIEDKRIPVEKKWTLEERVGIYLPDVSPEIKANISQAYSILDNSLAISIQLYLSEGEEEILSLAQYKENLLKNMASTQVPFQWLEEGSYLLKEIQVAYLEFLNITGLGIIHNLMLFAHIPYGNLIINLNFDNKDKQFWRPVMKAIAKTIEIK